LISFKGAIKISKDFWDTPRMFNFSSPSFDAEIVIADWLYLLVVAGCRFPPSSTLMTATHIKGFAN
jgi:hypothetical protein